MEDFAWAGMWITLIVSVLIFNLKKLKLEITPTEQLLEVKKLKDAGAIDTLEYEKIKSKLIKNVFKHLQTIIEPPRNHSRVVIPSDGSSHIFAKIQDFVTQKGYPPLGGGRGTSPVLKMSMIYMKSS